MATWNDKKPQGTDPLSEYPSMLTNQLTSIASALEQHFYWTVNSGGSAGIPVLSSVTGSARAYVGTESQVSASTATTLLAAQFGRTMVTSDTTRWYSLLSNSSSGATGTGTALLGSGSVVANFGGSAATIPSNMKVLVQSGSVSGLSLYLNTHVAFPSAYSATPVVQLTTSAADNNNVTMALLTGLGTSGFTVTVAPSPEIVGSPLSTTVYWVSTGTVAL